MKPLLLTACLLVFATSVFGQTTSQQKRLMRRGAVKVWTGVGLIAAGAVLVPLSEVGFIEANNDTKVTGTALMMAGGTLFWFGKQDQRKALQPNTTIGLMLGSQKGVQVRHRW